MAKGEAIRVVKARLEEAGITRPKPTYRLLGTPLAGSETQRATPDLQAPAQVEVQPVGTDDGTALEEIIEAERVALPDDDLLRQEAPQE